VLVNDLKAIAGETVDIGSAINSTILTAHRGKAVLGLLLVKVRLPVAPAV
jgi:hypothetical protein